MFPLGLLVKRKLENIEPSYISNSRYFNEDLKNSTDYRTSKYEEFIEVKENLRDLGIINNYTKKIPALRNLKYCERLKAFKINSQQRRLEMEDPGGPSS